MAISSPFRRLALVVGGGPAPGINGVISAVTIEATNRGIEVFGIEDGYKWMVKPDSLNQLRSLMDNNSYEGFLEKLERGNPSHIRFLPRHSVAAQYIRGGSLLGTSRTNPTKKKEDMDQVMRVFKTLEIDALVSIGGDDTAYSASQMYQHFKNSGGYLRVAHVPKTIDNDLPLPGSTPTFGFETARHFGTSTVRNLAEDARTTSRWYLVVCMGRAAGHLALGIGKAAAATLTIIPEEFGIGANGKPNKITFKHLCDTVLGSIIKRIANGKAYGVVVLAEGLIESVKDELPKILERTNGKYGTYKVDDFGNLTMAEIAFGELVRDLLTERLSADPKRSRPLHEILGLTVKPYGHEVPFIAKDLGYELRCADPIPFDAEYTRDLGYSAVKFLLGEDATHFGAVIGFIQGSMKPMKFEDMLDPETKRMKTRLVNVRGEGFEVARRYMIRLEKRDFENEEMLAKLAAVAKLSPQQFRDDFGYLI
ncbi:MAG TPA: 6-phosphofructokinase [Gemmataceae bacterium]|nr:6-phosphofructokinase [Gemmataceae bacterium]